MTGSCWNPLNVARFSSLDHVFSELNAISYWRSPSKEHIPKMLKARIFDDNHKVPGQTMSPSTQHILILLATQLSTKTHWIRTSTRTSHWFKREDWKTTASSHPVKESVCDNLQPQTATDGFSDVHQLKLAKACRQWAPPTQRCIELSTAVIHILTSLSLADAFCTQNKGTQGIIDALA